MTRECVEEKMDRYIYMGFFMKETQYSHFYIVWKMRNSYLKYFNMFVIGKSKNAQHILDNYSQKQSTGD